MSQTVNIEGLNFEESNVIFVNGLTYERVKMKYNWLLNAKIRDAIIGEDARGIVWYFGDWYCGEWLDGTWYSGNFYDGVWKNGLFYSYKLNKFDILNEIFNVEERGNSYSQFHKGYWLNGYFYSGTFGINNNEDWVDFELFYDTYANYHKIIEYIGGTPIYEDKYLATWVNGIFDNGLFYDAIWIDGRHVNGYMLNSKWIDGRWYNGTFEGHTWHNGYWYNGNFIKGVWLYGIFNQLDTNIVSRFGNTTLINNTDAVCEWYNGIFKKGEWFSGYLVNSNNNPIDSENHRLSIWYDGTWENGIWYGGHFYKGTWKNGIWKNGIFGLLHATEWIEPQLVSQNDMNNNYKWIGDVVNPTVTNISDNVIASNTSNTYYEWQNFNLDLTITGCTISWGNYILFTQTLSYTYNINDQDVTEDWGYDFNELISLYDFTLYINDREYTYLSCTNVGTNTWQIDISDWDIYIMNNCTVKWLFKKPVQLTDGSGSGSTYWSFNRIEPILTAVGYPAVQYYNYLSFVGTNLHDFNISDIVYVEQNDGYEIDEYNKLMFVIGTGITSTSEYYIKVWQLWDNSITNVNQSGKIVKYFGNMSERNSISETLMFQDFDFDFNEVTNTATTLINGYSVRFKTNIIKNGLSSNGFNQNMVWLPLKNLYLSDIDSLGFQYSPYDLGYYSDIYRTGNCAYITSGKLNNTEISNLIDGNKKTYMYGGFDDLWGMNNLQEYYPNSEGFDENNYNPTAIIKVNDTLRIGMNFKMNMTISQQLQISDIEIRAYYTYNNEIPIWLNGTWNRGTWYNGDFYTGKYLSGMWIKGNFYGGNIAANYR
jgi:hypothetical protein